MLSVILLRSNSFTAPACPSVNDPAVWVVTAGPATIVVIRLVESARLNTFTLLTVKAAAAAVPTNFTLPSVTAPVKACSKSKVAYSILRVLLSIFVTLPKAASAQSFPGTKAVARTGGRLSAEGYLNSNSKATDLAAPRFAPMPISCSRSSIPRIPASPTFFRTFSGAAMALPINCRPTKNSTRIRTNATTMMPTRSNLFFPGG